MTSVAAVIPVRNRPEVVLRAVDSVLSQTHPVDEIFIVDDASSDNTIESILKRFSDVRALRIIQMAEPGGAPKARNAGIAAAQSQFIGLLDSDDAWLPTKIERQLELLLAHPECPAAFCGTLYRFNRRGAHKGRTKRIVTRADLEPRNILGGCSHALVRRDALVDIGMFRPDLPSCQDWDLWLRLAQLGPLISSEESLVEYFFDGGERITKSPEKVKAGHEIVFQEIYAGIKDPDRLKKVRAEHLTRMGENYSVHQFRPLSALSALFVAFSLDPTPRRAIEIPKAIAKLAMYKLT